MKVGIETSIGKMTNAGIGRYAEGLMSGLEGTGNVFCSEISYLPRFSRSRRFFRIFDTLCREIVWMQCHVPRLCKDKGLDLLHVSNPMMPIRSPCPVVVTLHDLHPFQHPQNSGLWARNSFKFYLDLVVKHADAIIVVSTYSYNEFLRFYPSVSQDKLHVVLEGVDSQFCVLQKSEVDRVRQRYGLNHPFVFSLFYWSENKNISRLIKSFSKAELGSDFELVLAGGMNGRLNDAKAMAEKCGVLNRTKFLGYIPDDDLPALYNAAEVFCFPSLYEGFGLPPLEAMACGTPVIASNVTSIPEVVGDAGLLVDPLNCDDIANALSLLQKNSELRGKCIKSGLVRASELSWDRCAASTVGVYEGVI